MSVVDHEVRNARPRKASVDPWSPLDVLLEEEPAGAGRVEPALTIFLAGAECPFTCVFCDLWKYTSDERTPEGAIPRQIERGLQTLPPELDPGRLRVKLYNASNFFDARAVPPADDARILDLLAPFPAVTVENHPRLVNERCLAFGDGLSGRMEVALGLETVREETLARLNKRASVADFDRATAALLERGCDVRAFVLVGPPYQPPAETVEWAVRSVDHALSRGARFVALNPVRSGNGFMDALRNGGQWAPPSLRRIEAALAGALATARGRGIVVVDPWELERFADCDACGTERIANLHAMNAHQAQRPSVPCDACA